MIDYAVSKTTNLTNLENNVTANNELNLITNSKPILNLNWISIEE